MIFQSFSRLNAIKEKKENNTFASGTLQRVSIYLYTLPSSSESRAGDGAEESTVAQLPASGGTHRQLAVSWSREGAQLHSQQAPTRPKVSQGGSATCVRGAQRRSSGDGQLQRRAKPEKGARQGIVWWWRSSSTRLG